MSKLDPQTSVIARANFVIAMCNFVASACMTFLEIFNQNLPFSLLPAILISLIIGFINLACLIGIKKEKLKVVA